MFKEALVNDPEKDLGVDIEYCKFNITCINPNCDKKHKININSRVNIRETYIKLNKMEKKCDACTQTDFDDEDGFKMVVKKSIQITQETVKIINKQSEIHHNTIYKNLSDFDQVDETIKSEKFVEENKTKYTPLPVFQANIPTPQIVHTPIPVFKQDAPFRSDIKKPTKINLYSPYKTQCTYDIRCYNPYCKDTHSIVSVEARKKISSKYHELREHDKEYKPNSKLCFDNMLCANDECPYVHPFSYESRKKIIDLYTMIKNEQNDDCSAKSTVSAPSTSSLSEFPIITSPITSGNSSPVLKASTPLTKLSSWDDITEEEEEMVFDKTFRDVVISETE